jgi:polyisoprenoid-binding protein YceI
MAQNIQGAAVALAAPGEPNIVRDLPRSSSPLLARTFIRRVRFPTFQRRFQFFDAPVKVEAPGGEHAQRSWRHEAGPRKPRTACARPAAQERTMLRNSKSVLLLTAISVAIPGVATAAFTTGAGGHVHFLAIGPAGMKIAGESSEVKVSETASNVVIDVPLAPLKTGISLRDSHMRDKYLEVAKYPDAILTVGKPSLKLPSDGGASEGDAAGELALHGKKKQITFHYKVKRTAATYRVSGTVHVDMRDFGIETPGYLGVSVKPGVDVDVEFQAKDQ